MLRDLLIFGMCFLGIWISAGFVISSVEKFAHKLRISSFSVSFLILGLFTSLGEISVGINSVINNNPEIFVGNLVGATIMLFLLIIPLLATTGGKIKINPEFQGVNLFASLFTVIIPLGLSIDGQITAMEGWISIISFFVTAFLIESVRKSSKETTKKESKVKAIKELAIMFGGVLVIFILSRLAVDKTSALASEFGLSPFFISLLLVSFGTNLPELSLVVKSMFRKNNQVAFGDYIGSAVYNTLIFGSLTVWYGKTIILTNSFIISLLFLLTGVSLFYVFARSKNTISRKEGGLLLFVYLIFIVVELTTHFVF